MRARKNAALYLFGFCGLPCQSRFTRTRPGCPGCPFGSPPALLPQALRRTHGGPAKPYNTLHLLRRWCALAGGRRAASNRSTRFFPPRGCRQREPAPGHRTPFLPPRWVAFGKTAGAPLFPAAYFLPCDPGNAAYPRWRRGRRSKYQVEPRLTDLSPSSCLAFSTVLRLKPRWANRAKASLEGTSSC